MAKRCALLLTLLIAFVPLPSRASQWDYSWALPEWRATYAAPKLADNRGFAVAATADSVYVAGTAGSQGTGAGDLFLLKYGLDGALLWSRTWGGFELDQAQDIAVDAGGVWVAGSATTDAGMVQTALLRFTHAGDLTFARTYAFGVASIAQAVVSGPTGVFIAGLEQPTHAQRDLFVMRVDAAGTPLWRNTLDGGGWDEAWDLALDGSTLFLSGYTSPAAGSSLGLVQRLDAAGNVLASVTIAGPGNEEARAIAVRGNDLYVTGGEQAGRSTDVFVAKLDATTLAQQWHKTTGGAVVGGGGYGIALGDRGIYIAGGTYDFPAGGDSALMRFSYDGTLEWSQVAGLPGFWDWNFDVDARDGRFYVTGVLWQPGLEWYRVTTAAYDENFPTASLTQVGRWLEDGDQTSAQNAMTYFSAGDFIRWAEAAGAANPGSSRIEWEGASDSGRNYGTLWVDSSADPVVGNDNAAGSISGISNDYQSGNYSLVRDYTSVHGSLLDGLVRFRYTISHDRLIPQGGYLYVGELGVPIPPPPV